MTTNEEFDNDKLKGRGGLGAFDCPHCSAVHYRILKRLNIKICPRCGKDMYR